jgi:hypothetical protein
MSCNKGRGAAYAFVLAHVGWDGEGCLHWPFARDKHGRGLLGVNGKGWWAHRLMCTLAHGKPPTPKHTAAHSCGKGHDGCIHPQHLSWKTQKENLADCKLHGTQGRHNSGPVGKLTLDQVQKVRDLEPTHTQGQLAAMFNVSEGAINDIWRGRTWARPRKVIGWSKDEDLSMKRAIAEGKSFPEIAKSFGKTTGSISSRAYRIGLKSGRMTTRTDTHS